MPASPAPSQDSSHIVIAAGSALAIAVHLLLRFGLSITAPVVGIPAMEWPLIAALVLGGLPLLYELIRKILRGEFGSDLLAGLSIVTSLLLGEYLAGAFVVLMLSGGEALESYAVRSASSVLESLAKRVPSVAHRIRGGKTEDVALHDVDAGDTLTIFPHEICPVDGTVTDGRGVMDESYLTGEPFMMDKVPGSPVLSGSVNGATALVIRAEKRAVDSRYEKIMEVMRTAEERRPRLRRMADSLGAFYTPLALVIAVAAWMASGESVRFLAVLVVATPCPLLIAIPVAIIGSISLSARRGIIVKDPAVLERITGCRTAIFDKTGTLTYGQPQLLSINPAKGFEEKEVLRLVASLERYSKHPLAAAILEGAKERGIALAEASEVEERPSEGPRGTVEGRSIAVTSRKLLLDEQPALASELPKQEGGMECVAVIDGAFAGLLRFRDRARSEGASFVLHLGPRHHIERVLLVSGDRESEVRALASQVGITEVHAGKSPEEKLEIVRQETARADTVFLGDGINDAPALTAATVGIAFGQNSDITSEAAGAVILDTSLEKVDEFLHISTRQRRIALQSAVGGIAASVAGMLLAAGGFLPPVGGALLQEFIDLAAILNALRVAIPPRTLTDLETMK